MQLAASHVPQLKRTLRDFQQRFSERFGLRARTGAALLAPSIHEQHTAGNDDAAAAAAVDESSEHKGDMSSAELASVLDDELSERVESDTGTVYLVKQDLPHLACTSHHLIRFLPFLDLTLVFRLSRCSDDHII